jgi:HEAT repeat protein
MPHPLSPARLLRCAGRGTLSAGARWGLILGLGAALVAGRGIGPAVAQSLAAPSEQFPVFRELERMARDPAVSMDDRRAAIAGLGDAHTSAVGPGLVALLGDPAPGIREAAAAALGWPGNAGAVDALLARARDDGETPDVRRVAIEALGRIGAPAVVGPLESLSRDPAVGLRRAALLVLFDSPLARHADATGAALRLLEDSAQDGYARARAAVFLARVRGNPQVVAALRAVLRDPRPPAGYEALPAPEALAGPERTMAERLRALHNVRAHAAWALGNLQDRAALPDLQTALGDPDPEVRLRSAGSLGLLRAPEAVPSLVGLVADPDPLVRAMAVTALGELGDRSAAPALRGALRDADARVRERAARALGQVGDQEARDELDRLAQSEPASAVRLAVHAALRALDAAREHGAGSSGAPSLPWN